MRANMHTQTHKKKKEKKKRKESCSGDRTPPNRTVHHASIALDFIFSYDCEIVSMKHYFILLFANRMMETGKVWSER